MMLNKQLANSLQAERDVFLQVAQPCAFSHLPSETKYVDVYTSYRTVTNEFDDTKDREAITIAEFLLDDGEFAQRQVFEVGSSRYMLTEPYEQNEVTVKYIVVSV